MFNAFVNCC